MVIFRCKNICEISTENYFYARGGQPKLVYGPQLLKIAENIDFLGRIITKNTQNIEKSLILDSILGRGLATPVLCSSEGSELEKDPIFRIWAIRMDLRVKSDI